jgi:hypothetical protein
MTQAGKTKEKTNASRNINGMCMENNKESERKEPGRARE